MTPDELFWAKVDSNGSCWTWTACLSAEGYGMFRLKRRTRLAHRLAYEWLVGPIPLGLQLDHLCRNRACVNPDHLEPVTPKVNTQRSDAGKARGLQQRSLTHCLRGHPFNDLNTYKTPDGRRNCRTCRALATARYHARRASNGEAV